MFFIARKILNGFRFHPPTFASFTKLRYAEIRCTCITKLFILQCNALVVGQPLYKYVKLSRTLSLTVDARGFLSGPVVFLPSVN